MKTILTVFLTVFCLRAGALDYVSHDAVEHQTRRIAWLACSQINDIKDDALRAECLVRATGQLAVTDKNQAEAALQPAIEGLYRGLYFAKYKKWPTQNVAETFCRVQVGVRGPRCSVRLGEFPKVVAVLRRLDPLTYDIDQVRSTDHD